MFKAVYQIMNSYDGLLIFVNENTSVHDLNTKIQ